MVAEKNFAQLTGATILLTGGAGFIGSNLLERLIASGAHVRVLDNFFTGQRGNLIPFSGRFTLIESDLRDLDAVKTASRGCDFVIHQAAIPSVPRSIADPITTHEVNARGTLNILIAARDEKVRRVVFASSSSVYGETEILPKQEDLAPDPISPYAATKLMGEFYCRSFWRIYGLATVCLRYFNVFGPHQDPTSQYAAVIPNFITAAIAGRPLTIYGDGEQTRDFTFVENVVNANVAALFVSEAPGSVVNIASGMRVSVNDVARRILTISGSNAKIVHEPARAGDIRHSYADIRNAGSVLGYEVTVGPDEGLKRTIAWYQREARELIRRAGGH